MEPKGTHFVRFPHVDTNPSLLVSHRANCELDGMSQHVAVLYNARYALATPNITQSIDWNHWLCYRTAVVVSRSKCAQTVRTRFSLDFCLRSLWKLTRGTACKGSPPDFGLDCLQNTHNSLSDSTRDSRQSQATWLLYTSSEIGS